MTEHIKNLEDDITGVLSREKGNAERSLEKAKTCLVLLEIAKEFRYYGILLNHLEDAGVTPEDIGTTRKKIDILMLKVHLWHLQWALDIIRLLDEAEYSHFSLLRIRIVQTTSFACSRVATLIGIKGCLRPSQDIGFGYEPDEPTKKAVIESLKKILVRAKELADAIDASDSIKNLEEFLAILDAASKLAEKNQQILCGSA